MGQPVSGERGPRFPKATTGGPPPPPLPRTTETHLQAPFGGSGNSPRSARTWGKRIIYYYYRLNHLLSQVLIERRRVDFIILLCTIEPLGRSSLVPSDR
jgi:hypothetical protein